MLSFYFINFRAGAHVGGVMRLFVSDLQNKTFKRILLLSGKQYK